MKQGQCGVHRCEYYGPLDTSGLYDTCPEHAPEKHDARDARISDLEAALRKVDEIRIRMGKALDTPLAQGDGLVLRARVTAWVLALKAPCKVIYK